MAKQDTIESPDRKIRELSKITSGNPTSDGQNVRLIRFIGSQDINLIDPFLLFDLFQSDRPADYLGGFPDHPHRGFETVTYLLAGRMRHKDNASHEGVIEAGGIQWMTAGRGIVHSEMPEQKNGLLRGFQLWINLPSSKKMVKPSYQEFSAAYIPSERLSGGGSIKVISGCTSNGTRGPVNNPYTEPIFLDIDLGPEQLFEQNIPDNHNSFLYVIHGTLLTGTSKSPVGKEELGILGSGNHVSVSGEKEGARFLLITGKRLNEPIARSGPFVMNTKEEIYKAYRDYRNGNFGGRNG